MKWMLSVSWLSRSARVRTAVLVVGALVLIPKLVIAARTYGTTDVIYWNSFAQGVGLRGPVGVYEVTFPGTVYNYPPLIGYYLQVMNVLVRAGVPVGFTIRAVSSIADVASAVLVFELLRRRRSLPIATLAGVFVAASPGPWRRSHTRM